MELNNGEIFMAREPLGKLLSEKFPVKVSYGLAKLANKLNNQLKVIDDTRNSLVAKHGKHDAAGQVSVDLKSESYGKFMEELTELFNVTVELDIEKVMLPEKVAATCDKCSHNMDRPLEIEPNALMQLDKFVGVS